MNTDSTQTRLSLYHYPACPFCAYTRAAIKSLKLDVAQRDIAVNPGYRRELRQGGGKTQVPCLKIETGGRQISESLALSHANMRVMLHRARNQLSPCR
ncbi:MAG: glutaredoxin [Spongiibacter sp.]|uniref:glutaredoxin family protein n=1 Tax=Spongiibacter sp. TaxID=2024860 RepID=UPI000C0A9382|nr:glutaredoxin domain-containing protein [Spongiibacter sp.]MAK45531.1 glutaredoxin [Spongiibacter sp.]|tara:strand:- start:742 stop:1035 length:294 start_codon:yes stop_codon:yes gene_type:complete